MLEIDPPLKLSEAFQPYVLIKDGYDQLGQIMGAALVLSRGGQVQSLGIAEGYSSSGLIEKIRRL